MVTSWIAERDRLLSGSYLLIIAIATVFIVGYHALHPDAYIPGDWLINYEGGFVRRGLIGEGILLLAHTLHLPAVGLASILPLLFYLVFYWLFWLLWRRGQDCGWSYVSLFSPATLAFPILCPLGASHKESLVFVALAGLLLVGLSNTISAAMVSLYLAFVMSIILLSHEGLAPFLIYLGGAVLLFVPRRKHAAAILAAPLVVAALVIVSVADHSGNNAIERAVCASLGTTQPMICSGAIAYLAKDKAIAHNDVLDCIQHLHYLLYYPLLALLSISPLAAYGFALRRRSHTSRNLAIVAGLSLMAVAASVPLFEYGTDWGRWIYIHAMCMFLLLMLVDAQSASKAETTSGLAARFSNVRYGKWRLAALVLYVTCWNMPYGGDNVKKGYLNVPLHLLNAGLRYRR